MERLILSLTPEPLTVELAADTSSSRTISGVAVPWNTVARASSGPVKFLPGSLPTLSLIHI